MRPKSCWRRERGVLLGAQGSEQKLHIRRVGIGGDAVAEIEDVGAARKGIAYRARLIYQRIAAGNHQHRIKVALNAGERLQHIGGGDRIDAGVNCEALDIHLICKGFVASPAPRGKPMTGTLGCLARIAAMIFCAGSMAQRANIGPGSAPAQLSKSLTTSAPASIWAIRYAAVASVITSRRAKKAFGSLYISDLAAPDRGCRARRSCRWRRSMGHRQSR